MNNQELLTKYDGTTTAGLKKQVETAVETANIYVKQPERNEKDLAELQLKAIALVEDYNRIVKLRRLKELVSMPYGDAVNAVSGVNGETCEKMEISIDSNIMNITTSNSTRIRWSELLKDGQRPANYSNLESLVKVFTHNCFANKFDKGELTALPSLDPAVKAVANGHEGWDGDSMKKLEAQLCDLIRWMFPVEDVGEYPAPRKADVRWFTDIVCPASDKAGEPAHYMQRKMSTLLDSLFRVFYTLKEGKDVGVRPAKTGKK